ncbi:MAG: dihydropteroate synthase [Chitinophagaceae bacterium]|nr:dihydropteroate synthase [Chitinophagaceae bacterium]
MYTLNCKGRPVSLEEPLVMGVLNFTNDSFYPGSRLPDAEAVLTLAMKMADEGVDIIDIGAQSTRSGSTRISAQEEIEKLLPLVPLIAEKTGKIISIDTYHAQTAEALINAGAHIVNDISGGTMDDQMIATVGRLGVPYICMHIKGTPENMQEHTDYEDILKELLEFFIDRIGKCKAAGIHDIIIDPGFGFAKTREQNLYLLKNLSVFKILEKPILVGLSRKSTIYRTLNITPDEALNGTTVLNTIALMNGSNILRVHDVKEAREAVVLYEAYKKAAGSDE